MLELPTSSVEHREVVGAYQEITKVETYTYLHTSPMDRRTMQARKVKVPGRVTLHPLFRNRSKPGEMAQGLLHYIENLGECEALDASTDEQVSQ